MKKLFLATVLVLLSNPVRAAVDCSTIPSCEDLGYTYTAAECSGFSSIRCFYDKSKFFCNPVSNANQCSDPNKVYGSVAVGAAADCYCKQNFVNVNGECKDGLTYCHAQNKLFISSDTLGASLCVDCLGGKTLDKTTNTCTDCTTCPANSTYNTNSKKCLCNIGTFYDTAKGTCVGSTRTYHLVVGHSATGYQMQIADLSSAKEYTATTVSNLTRSMMATVSTLAENKPTIAHYNVIKEVLGSSMPNIGTPSSVGADCFLASDGMYNLRQNKSASYSSYTTPAQFLADSVLKNCVTSDKTKLGATILKINRVDGIATTCLNTGSYNSDWAVVNPNLDLNAVQQYEGGVVDMGETTSSGTSTGTSTGSSSGNSTGSSAQVNTNYNGSATSYGSGSSSSGGNLAGNGDGVNSGHGSNGYTDPMYAFEHEVYQAPDGSTTFTQDNGNSNSQSYTATAGDICTPPITSSVVCLQCGYTFDATTGTCKTGSSTTNLNMNL